ncbi:hypothetical protein HOV25_gp06 [Pseudomonas phage RLP]|uniref:Uncharacterized protein n=1 Tax=Pseudomonas phage RLP TaxID=2483418 RepID=A0A455NTG1_9CAUD|nr:hypothetical protein HOV25_gp06 [Pseudomonas phage RLP]AZS49139.1 hypothetical protein RLP_0006 [Pseudomonas phage RLP]
MAAKRKILWKVSPHEIFLNVHVIRAHEVFDGGVNYVTGYITKSDTESPEWPQYFQAVIQEMQDTLLSQCKLAVERWFRAEIISIGEWREYRAMTLEEAAGMAEAEFGQDDIGRVIERR